METDLLNALIRYLEDLSNTGYVKDSTLLKLRTLIFLNKVISDEEFTDALYLKYGDIIQKLHDLVSLNNCFYQITVCSE